MINVTTASFVATTDKRVDKDGEYVYVGKVWLGNVVIWEGRIGFEDTGDATVVMDMFAEHLRKSL